ncbi:MAG: 3-deoxy-D-manno-octulosonate 8-phosphate phosphatase (KDO 8-P phosphatase) [Paraglaciecola sp.]|jgi:3-deoxy-D-manno-octulosonate 8-phosphate phosphatase (KDO 8-P phosphatase)
MTQISTFYGLLEKSVMDKLATIKLLACDVDGVFSDGRIYLGNQGEELKAFHTRDGYGVKALQSIGVQVAVITGRRSHIVEQRMQSLGVKHIKQGCEDKYSALVALQKQLGVSVNTCASMGDDVPDLGMFTGSSFTIAVADAHPLVQKNASYVTLNKGGFGAVREICDLILQARGKLDGIRGSSI